MLPVPGSKDKPDTQHLLHLLSLPSVSATASAGSDSLPGEGDPDLHIWGIWTLVPLPFSGSDCYTYLLTINTGQKVSRNTQMDHLGAKHILPCPHCVTPVLPLPDGQDQLLLPGAWKDYRERCGLTFNGILAVSLGWSIFSLWANTAKPLETRAVKMKHKFPKWITESDDKGAIPTQTPGFLDLRIWPTGDITPSP